MSAVHVSLSAPLFCVPGSVPWGDVQRCAVRTAILDTTTGWLQSKKFSNLTGLKQLGVIIHLLIRRVRSENESSVIQNDFTVASGVRFRDGNVFLSIVQTTSLVHLKYLYNDWMNCHGIWHTRSCEDEL